jgi:hypothetical protein
MSREEGEVLSSEPGDEDEEGSEGPMTIGSHGAPPKHVWIARFSIVSAFLPSNTLNDFISSLKILFLLLVCLSACPNSPGGATVSPSSPVSPGMSKRTSGSIMSSQWSAGGAGMMSMSLRLREGGKR